MHEDANESNVKSPRALWRWRQASQSRVNARLVDAIDASFALWLWTSWVYRSAATLLLVVGDRSRSRPTRPPSLLWAASSCNRRAKTRRTSPTLKPCGRFISLAASSITRSSLLPTDKFPRCHCYHPWRTVTLFLSFYMYRIFVYVYLQSSSHYFNTLPIQIEINMIRVKFSYCFLIVSCMKLWERSKIQLPYLRKDKKSNLLHFHLYIIRKLLQ